MTLNCNAGIKNKWENCFVAKNNKHFGQQRREQFNLTRKTMLYVFVYYHGLNNNWSDTVWESVCNV